MTTTLCGALALTAVRAYDAPSVATGFVAHVLCSETFVSGLDPDRVFSETTAAMPGTGLITWAMDYKIDRARKDVTVTLLGGGQSHGVYREGLGCYISRDDGSVDASLPSAASNTQHVLLPEIGGPSLVEPANQELGLALDRAFAEPDQPPFRHTKAVVVLKDGHVVAERYAPNSRSMSPPRSQPGRIRTIPAMRSRSTICSGTPVDWRWAVRSMPRSPAPSRRSTR